MPSKNKTKEYYAVVKGRIDKPTIFSSWGDAHPRVTGCNSIHEAFATIEEAREYLETFNVSDYREVIKDGAGSTTPQRNSDAFFAVACGKRPGIYPFCGKKGAIGEVKKFGGACHKKFRTRLQAEAFIEDWKQSITDVYARRIMQLLNEGHRPHSMDLDKINVLFKTEDQTGIDDHLNGLTLDEAQLEG